MPLNEIANQRVRFRAFPGGLLKELTGAREARFRAFCVSPSRQGFDIIM